MEAKDLLRKLTKDDVIHILTELYNLNYIHDKQGNVIFESACHGSANYKLYYYEGEDGGKFHCYICGTHGNLIDLLVELSGYTFQEAMQSIGKVLGINVNTRKKVRGLNLGIEENKDMDFLSIHNRKIRETRRIETFYDDSVLSRFDEVYPLCWQQEGIDGYTAEKFDLRFDHNHNRAIIPVRNLDGKLIGIRVRNFDEQTVERGFKYMPLEFQGESYRFPTSTTLYGLYENQHTIRAKRKAIIFEGEKSTMVVDSYYQGECFALATYGTNFSHVHRDELLKLGVSEVTIAWDKEYCEEYYDEKYNGTKEQKLMFSYFEKLKKVCKLLHSYMTVNLIIDFDNELSMKDAPCDKGKQTFESLMKKKITISDVDEDFEELFGV